MGAYARTAWRLICRTPGPWLVAASVGGWLLLIARAASLPDGVAAMAAHHAGHLKHHGMIGWAAMVLAMSPLVLRSEIGWLRRTNLPRNRALAIALFGLGYTLPWLLLGITWLRLLAGRELGSAAIVTLIVVLLVWHGSPSRQRLLNACHRRPALRAFGRPMATDTARFGIEAGAICTGVCGPAMLLVMALPEMHLLAMGAFTVWLTVERYLAPRRPRWRLPWSLTDPAPRWRSYAFIAAPATPTS